MRETKYNALIPTYLPELFAQGQSIVEVCVMLNISRKTWYRWVEKYPAFAEAAERGSDKSQAWWVKLGREGADGKRKANSIMWKYNMANRFGWRDKKELSADPDAPPQVVVLDSAEYVAARRAMLASDDC